MIKKIPIPTPFPIGDVNSFLLKGDALSLIDAGPRTPEAYEAIKAGLKQAGYSFYDIEQVILTHHHPDHSGWVDGFERSILMGHAYNQPFLTRDQEFMERQTQFYADSMQEEGVPDLFIQQAKKMDGTLNFIGKRPLDIVLKEGDALPGHEGWKVLETLGHAQSHISLWNEKTGEMIGGDLVLEKVSSNPLVEPPLDPDDDRPRSLLQYNNSLKRLLDIPVNIIYSGHGDEVRNVHSLIEGRLEQQHDRAMKVLEMMEQEPRTVYELTMELFPHVYKKELGLTLSETIGQTDYLVNIGAAKETCDADGILHYEKA